MSTLIDTSKVLQDTWVTFDGDAADIAAGSDVILPIEEWLERTSVWRDHAGRVAVLLEPGDDPERLAATLPDLTMVVVDFPAFTDGRGFSIARLLRSRYSFAGAVRASGQIIADQVLMLRRCGFTEFNLPDDHAAGTALRLLQIAVPTYQPDASGGRTIALPGERPTVKSRPTLPL